MWEVAVYLKFLVSACELLPSFSLQGQTGPIPWTYSLQLTILKEDAHLSWRDFMHSMKALKNLMELWTEQQYGQTIPFLHGFHCEHSEHTLQLWLPTPILCLFASRSFRALLSCFPVSSVCKMFNICEHLQESSKFHAVFESCWFVWSLV